MGSKDTELEQLKERVSALERKVYYVAPPPEAPEPLPVTIDLVCIGVRETGDLGKVAHKSFILEDGQIVRYNPEGVTHAQMAGKRVVQGGYENPVSDLSPDALRNLFREKCSLVAVERTGDLPPTKRSIRDLAQLEEVISRIAVTV